MQNVMIHPSQLAPFLRQQLPDLTYRLVGSAIRSPFSIMQSFAEFAHQHIRQTHLLRQCFELANILYRNGSGEIKLAVENVFLFSLSAEIDLSPEREKILQLLPARLQALLQKQEGSLTV